LVEVTAILDVIKPCTYSYTRTLRFWCHAVAHSLTHSADFAFGSISGFKKKCRARARFGLVISGSGFKTRPGYNSAVATDLRTLSFSFLSFIFQPWPARFQRSHHKRFSNNLAVGGYTWQRPAVV